MKEVPIERMIDLIQKRKGLYDKRSKDYKSLTHKDKLYKEIASILKIKPEVVRIKWKNLRDSYAKHLKAKKSKNDQIKFYNKYVKWPWAEQMKFLRPFMGKPNTNSNISSLNSKKGTEESNQNIYELSDGTRIYSLKEEESSSAILYEQPTMEDCLLLDNKNEIEDLTETFEESKIEERKCYYEENVDVGTKDDLTKQIIRYVEKSEKRLEEFDDMDLICLGYARSLKKLPKRHQISAKFKIAKIIMEEEVQAELERVDLLSNSNAHSPQYNSLSSLSPCMEQMSSV